MIEPGNRFLNGLHNAGLAAFLSVVFWHDDGSLIDSYMDKVIVVVGVPNIAVGGHDE